MFSILARWKLRLLFATHWSAALTMPTPGPSHEVTLEPRYINDFSCQSADHPNPVVLIHALYVNENLDLNFLGAHLKDRGYCTFSKTYGAYPAFPEVGGVRAINETAVEVADFIFEVKSKTGAAKIDLVGHSEGGFQALYVPKFVPGVSAIVDKIVGFGIPTHGTDVSNVVDLAYIAGSFSRELVKEVLDTFGCPACDDIIIGGTAVARLNAGPIRQPDNDILILSSERDEVATPPEKSFVYEPGVTNKYVQDRCPLDFVGHIGLALDRNVWDEVEHWLNPNYSLPSTSACSAGVPVK